VAEAKLPEEVKRQGVTTKKKSPSILMCVNLISDKVTDAKTGKPTAAKMDLVRLTLPRRTYTQSHFDWVIESFERLVERKSALKGLRIVKEPPFLRGFTARLAPL
jgi:tryptophanase